MFDWWSTTLDCSNSLWLVCCNYQTLWCSNDSRIDAWDIYGLVKRELWLSETISSLGFLGWWYVGCWIDVFIIVIGIPWSTSSLERLGSCWYNSCRNLLMAWSYVWLCYGLTILSILDVFEVSQFSISHQSEWLTSKSRHRDWYLLDSKTFKTLFWTVDEWRIMTWRLEWVDLKLIREVISSVLELTFRTAEWCWWGKKGHTEWVEG